ncbi:hypothetical protein [Xanthomonas phaseoli]|uniref:Uncharacterized protein n=1 Tax=Xanthomonas manihotis TaxID=43353 RepID=A0A8I1XKA6_XANMN|nr:hypothetical protein [Xanthomonas phaseoli]KUF35349.1 hypothetical protein AO826_04790 [Xanthomonas phaseoli pv. manihotis]MBO9720219.1 hypothetical protein [Xanthomonas phaseoli pv. manihotis]MBO9754394.1 hypothetical protein [Xanthomonas phaseoli pv. manihotis]MBO9759603.1 hypothetical protein [Xanthomonas phaseoli pv. manihotis]MBO9765195.1 hypothetical protein [Xanthomonas phaseoli pv. manihotis]
MPADAAMHASLASLLTQRMMPARNLHALTTSCRRRSRNRGVRTAPTKNDLKLSYAMGKRRLTADRLRIRGNFIGGVRTERFNTLLQTGIRPLHVFRLHCELLVRRLCKRAILQTCTQLRLQAFASGATTRCARPLRRRRRSHLLVSWMPSSAMLALRTR